MTPTILTALLFLLLLLVLGFYGMAVNRYREHESRLQPGRGDSLGRPLR